MTRLTDERLRHIKDAPEGCTLDLNGVEVQSLVSELLLLRAECRAARDLENIDRLSSSADTISKISSARRTYDSARKATDEAGFKL